MNIKIITTGTVCAIAVASLSSISTANLSQQNVLASVEQRGAKDDARIFYETKPHNIFDQWAYVKNNNDGQRIRVTVSCTLVKGIDHTKEKDLVITVSPGGQAYLAQDKGFGWYRDLKIVGARYLD